MPSSSKNQQHGKYSGGSTSGYGAGAGSGASSSFGAGRTRDSQSYGIGKSSSIKDSTGVGGTGQRKSIYDRADNVTSGVRTTGGYTPNSSAGMNNSRTMNGSSALGMGSSGYNKPPVSSYDPSMLSQTVKQKSKEHPLAKTTDFSD